VDTEIEKIETQILFRLPSSPSYMSILPTLNGKPSGIPLWSTFINKEERSFENEGVSSTFISLAKTISQIATDDEKDGKIVRISLDNRTFNIYTPHPDDDFQIAFIVVFEDQDKILIEDKYKEELVQSIVKVLRDHDEFRKFLGTSIENQIDRSNPLYKDILSQLSKTLIKWDKKRVQYLEKQLKKERERIEKLIKEMEKEQEEQS